jgi:hypothetical protein
LGRRAEVDWYLGVSMSSVGYMVSVYSQTNPVFPRWPWGSYNKWHLPNMNHPLANQVWTPASLRGWVQLAGQGCLRKVLKGTRSWEFKADCSPELSGVSSQIHAFVIFFFFFLVELGFELRASCLQRRILLLESSLQVHPFWSVYFGDGASQTIYLDWPQTGVRGT